MMMKFFQLIHILDVTLQKYFLNQLINYFQSDRNTIEGFYENKLFKKFYRMFLSDWKQFTIFMLKQGSNMKKKKATKNAILKILEVEVSVEINQLFDKFCERLSERFSITYSLKLFWLKNLRLNWQMILKYNPKT